MKITSHVRAIIVLPVSVTVFVPLGVLLFTNHFQWPWTLRWSLAAPVIVIGLVCVIAGLWLMMATDRLFVRLGQGTPAPWDPPKKMVVAGPYRYVRNPMIIGVCLVLLGESVLLVSRPLFIWFALFLAGNILYLRFREQPRLDKRFGAAYREYRLNVRAWIPRAHPWTPTPSSTAERN